MQFSPSTSTIWLTAKEAAAYAKFRPATLRRAVRAGHLRAFRINDQRHVRFRVEDLDAWLSASPIEAKG